jgi:hypothetical protein
MSSRVERVGIPDVHLERWAAALGAGGWNRAYLLIRPFSFPDILVFFRKHLEYLFCCRLGVVSMRDKKDEPDKSRTISSFRALSARLLFPNDLVDFLLLSSCF